MAEWPTEEELLSAVQSAGWLLEHHAVRILDAADCHPRISWAFQDPDEPTSSRELDVWSYRSVWQDESHKLRVTARFLVECKQSSLPYVGIGHDLPPWRFRAPTQHVMPARYVREEVNAQGSYREIPAWHAHEFHSIAEEHGHTNFRVTQLTRLDRKNGGWEAKNTGVFTALVLPLAKALRASQKGINPQGPLIIPPGTASSVRPRSWWLDFALHFPVVLISCPLYVVDASSARPEVRKAKWASAVRELKSKNIEGMFEFDIVTEDAFKEYVEDRLGFARAIARAVEQEPAKYTRENYPPL